MFFSLFEYCFTIFVIRATLHTPWNANHERRTVFPVEAMQTNGRLLFRNYIWRCIEMIVITRKHILMTHVCQQRIIKCGAYEENPSTYWLVWPRGSSKEMFSFHWWIPDGIYKFSWLYALHFVKVTPTTGSPSRARNSFDSIFATMWCDATRRIYVFFKFVCQWLCNAEKETSRRRRCASLFVCVFHTFAQRAQ